MLMRRYAAADADAAAAIQLSLLRHALLIDADAALMLRYADTLMIATILSHDVTSAMLDAMSYARVNEQQRDCLMARSHHMAN